MSVAPVGAAGVRAGLHYLLAQGAATLLVMLASYAANRVWTFSRG
ncbi:hypothetical protein [Klebsiella pneumoniae]